MASRNQNFQAAGGAHRGNQALIGINEQLAMASGIVRGENNHHHHLQPDSGEAEEGGREGEGRYFNDITADEGTGGESYNQQNQIQQLHHASSGHSGQYHHQV